MWARRIVFFFCLLLALSLAAELKGDGPAPDGALPTVPAGPGGDEKHHPKDPKHPPKEHKHKEPKHPPKEKHHKDPKDKHPKEKEPVAAAAGAATEETARSAPAAEETQEEESKPAASPAKKKPNWAANYNNTDAAVEEDAQKEACGTICGVDLKDVASKLPFVNKRS